MSAAVVQQGLQAKGIAALEVHRMHRKSRLSRRGIQYEMVLAILATPQTCVKCLGEHGTSECPRPKDRTQCTEPPSCTNCRQSGHPANYRGCPRAPKYKSNYRTNQAPKAKAPQAEKFVLAPAPTRNPWFPATVRADSRPQAQGGGSPGGSPATPATTPAAAATVPAPVPTPSTSKATSSKVVKSKAPAPSKPQVAATPASSGAASPSLSFSLVSPEIIELHALIHDCASKMKALGRSDSVLFAQIYNAQQRIYQLTIESIFSP
ncbi:flocculation protein FLO11-like [Manduca sexta]|uniref:flocculation protein FLO11-like n=1 Tax=Manduca sexta TaxID=7130 RepID=UPI00188E90C8|nr:flocculation protein FLO11-like [Manduca sexta]